MKCEVLRGTLLCFLVASEGPPGEGKKRLVSPSPPSATPALKVQNGRPKRHRHMTWWELFKVPWAKQGLKKILRVQSQLTIAVIGYLCVPVYHH